VIESHPARTLIFGLFQADFRSGELRKAGTRIKLQQKPFQALELLLEHPGELVERQELRQRLWPAATFLDFDHSVATAIGKLRQALGDCASNPRFIETLGNRGYRFIAPVTELQSDEGCRSEQPHAAVVSATGAPPELPTQHRRFFRPVTILGILLSGIGFGPFVWHLSPVHSRGSVPVLMQSIAVLPIASLSGDPYVEYLAEGITDALITNLANVSSLRVISRTSVMRYVNTRKPLFEIAQELKVQAVVEGTITLSRDRIRINARLVQVEPEKHLWADAYERDRGDEVRLEGEVARLIASQVQDKLMQQQEGTASTSGR
jgi:TolB-like protein/DNA-binding winged helix-turn-helix (wHTH) protein